MGLGLTELMVVTVERFLGLQDLSPLRSIGFGDKRAWSLGVGGLGLGAAIPDPQTLPKPQTPNHERASS